MTWMLAGIPERLLCGFRNPGDPSLVLALDGCISCFCEAGVWI